MIWYYKPAPRWHKNMDITQPWCRSTVKIWQKHIVGMSCACRMHFMVFSTACSRQAYGITRFPWQQQPPTSISKIYPSTTQLDILYILYMMCRMIHNYINIHIAPDLPRLPYLTIPNLLNLITSYTSCSPEWQWCWHTYRWPRRLNPPHGSRRCSSSSLVVSPVQASFPRSIFPAQTPRDGSWWLMMLGWLQPTTGVYSKGIPKAFEMLDIIRVGFER